MRTAKECYTAIDFTQKRLLNHPSFFQKKDNQIGSSMNKYSFFICHLLMEVNWLLLLRSRRRRSRLNLILLFTWWGNITRATTKAPKGLMASNLRFVEFLSFPLYASDFAQIILCVYLTNLLFRRRCVCSTGTWIFISFLFSHRFVIPSVLDLLFMLLLLFADKLDQQNTHTEYSWTPADVVPKFS